MPYRYYGRRARKPTKSSRTARPTARRVSARKKVSFSLSKQIKQITLKNQETKIKTWQLFDNQEPINFGLRLGGAGNLGLLRPNVFGSPVFIMNQGTNQQERVGNVINNCYLTISGYVYSLPVDATHNFSPYPFTVKLIFYKAKNDPNGGPNEMLQYPDNTNGPFLGDTSTLTFPYNKKSYTIKKVLNLRMKANPFLAVSTTPNPVGIENPQWNGSADQAYRLFNCSIPVKRSLMFDDGGTSPQNDWLALGVSVHNGDGSVITPTGSQQRRCRVTAYATLRYKDS